MTSLKVPIVENILSANDQIARANRALFDAHHVFAINLMSSPGAGKTMLIEQTLAALQHEFRIAVIDGDIATTLDADRAAAAGAIAVQINTGGNCHLEAMMVSSALSQIDLAQTDLLIIENVGNLVCPSGWNLGTHQSVLISSVPEGADKPYKYPGMYRGVNVVLINKIDLLPYVDFDMPYFVQGIELLNPGVATFPISCRTGEGLAPWLNWLRTKIAEHRAVAQSA